MGTKKGGSCNGEVCAWETYVSKWLRGDLKGSLCSPGPADGSGMLLLFRNRSQGGLPGSKRFLLFWSLLSLLRILAVLIEAALHS